MKMLRYYLIFALLNVGAHAQEMGVLIGGLDSEDHSHWTSVDIYTKHLDDADKKCETGAEPTIPDFPFGTSKHNAIYLPNSGIYVCGWLGQMSQQMSECWNYNPKVSGEWTKVTAELEGAENAAIIAGTSADISNTDGFWIMGGINYEKKILNDTIFLDVSNSDNKFQPGVKLPMSLYGHCALNVKIPLDEDVFQAAIVIGGYEGMDRFQVRSTEKTWAYCQNPGSINVNICSKESTSEYGWTNMPPTNSIIYGKKGFGHTYCTQFTDEDLCDGVCIIAHGTWNQYAEYFPLERCAKNGGECEWMDEINGKKLEIPNFADHALGGMTTLNNIPTLFLPLYNNTGSSGWQKKWTEVMQFKDNEWKTIEQLDNNRGSFVPISVPKEFLCIEPPPPGPTTEENSTGSTSENSAAQLQYGELSLIVLGAFLLSKTAA